MRQALVIAQESKHGIEENNRLIKSLASVIFLGTPHKGSNYAFLGRIRARIGYWVGANPELLALVEPNSKEANQLDTDFTKHYPYKDFPQMDYFETKPSAGWPGQRPLVSCFCRIF